MKSYIAINVIGVILLIAFLAFGIGNYYAGKTFNFSIIFMFSLGLGLIIMLAFVPYCMLFISLALSNNIDRRKKFKGYAVWILYPSFSILLLNVLPTTIDGVASVLLEKVSEEELVSFALDAAENRPESYTEKSEILVSLRERHPRVSNISPEEFRVWYGETYIDIYWKTGFDSGVGIRIATKGNFETPDGFGISSVKRLTPKLYLYTVSS